MAPSKKTPVIEWIFRQKFNELSGDLFDSIVTFEDVRNGIEAVNNGLSSNNTANFWKDLTRSPNRNAHWPEAVFAAGFTGGDAIGAGVAACFEFVRVQEDQTEPFPEDLPFAPSSIERLSVQSLSMPLAMKALGRRDENWLSQVAARLSILETFFAVVSPRHALEVSFLQTGVKMRDGESDAVFSVKCDDGTWLVSVEAKGLREPLHLPQIARAAHSLYLGVVGGQSALAEVVGVIPFGLKIVDDSEIWAVEFEPVTSADDVLVRTAEAVFELTPPVPGIS